MKTIEVTDKMAKTIEAWRNEDSDAMEVINRHLCKAFAAVSGKMIAGDNALFPALYILTDYQELIEGLTQEGE